MNFFVFCFLFFLSWAHESYAKNIGTQANGRKCEVVIYANNPVACDLPARQAVSVASVKKGTNKTLIGGASAPFKPKKPQPPLSGASSWQKMTFPKTVYGPADDAQGVSEGEGVVGYRTTGLALTGYPQDFLVGRPAIVTQSYIPEYMQGVDMFGILVNSYNVGLVGSPRMDFTSGPGTLLF